MVRQRWTARRRSASASSAPGSSAASTPAPRASPARGSAGVAASSPASAAAAAAEIGAERAFDSAEELVASDAIDVVHVCTPNHLHLPLALAALEAGKHVVCEKPVALDADRGRASSAAAAERAGRVATVPFVYRYYPTVREARARARAGALGDLQLLYGGYLQDWLLGAGGRQLARRARARRPARAPSPTSARTGAI